MFEFKIHQATNIMFKAAYKFFAMKLGISEEQLELLEIKVVKRLAGASGNCSGLYTLSDELVKVKIKIQDYGSDLGIVDVLAHEMVHAKQHFNGEFSFAERTIPFLKFFKMTERIQLHKGQILVDTPYFERLCEQEAFTLSKELTRDFLNFFYDAQNCPQTSAESNNI